MKLVAIAGIKNELDIIEAFVSHHARHFDKLIVLDDGSSDGTFEVLQQLRSEYKDLVVLRQPTIGYRQQEKMTLLLRMAVNKFGADWVAPLDADEFIEPNQGLLLGEVLAAQQPAVYRLRWNNFLWTADLERRDERNPVLRQRFRLPPRAEHSKLLIHRQFANGGSELTLGNHSLLRADGPVPTQPLDCVQLCHYPVRSIAQYAGKIAIGYLQYLAMPDWDRLNGFHYIKPFRALTDFGLEGITNLMHRDSLFYGRDESEPTDNRLAVEAPLNYVGESLTIKMPERSAFSNVLLYAEAMAAQFASNARQAQNCDRASIEIALLQKRNLDVELELQRLRGEIFRQNRQLQSRTFRLLTRVYVMLIRLKILRQRP